MSDTQTTTDTPAADDLLASMADEAIDRMLSGEADASAEPVAAATADEAALDALLRGEAEAATRPEQVEEPAAIEQTAASSAAAAVAAELSVDEAVKPLPSIDEFDDEDDFGMEDVSLPPAELPEEEKLPASSADVAPALRPLVWLDRPLGKGKTAAREAVGKVALVTLLNASAILTYVLVLRG
jgi:hypothetical protein